MSLQIDSITLREIRLPLVEPFRISSGVTTTRRILLLELVDADGASTWSRVRRRRLPELHAGEHRHRDSRDPRMAGAAGARPALRDARGCVGRPGRGPSAAHEMAQAAIEMGAWALAATKAGQSLSSLLGRDAETDRHRHLDRYPRVRPKSWPTRRRRRWPRATGRSS